MEDWKIRLQQDFPFMKQNAVEEERNTYRRWGFECSGGWYLLLRECCEAIVSRYAEDGIDLEDIDFVPVQIKEKFGTLRFYYGYVDAPCTIAAFDNLATGESIRFGPKSEGNVDDATAKRREDIRDIVRTAEERSRTTCEICGATGRLRDRSEGHSWIRTLCDECQEKSLRARAKSRRSGGENGMI